jgi:glycine/sarcosine N-methyltransferase
MALAEVAVPAARDAYEQIGYRGVIAWPERLQRETILFQRVMGSAPVPRLLDLGCGTGEHSRFLHSLGFEVCGVDASGSQLEAAREADPGGHYVQASLSELSGAGLQGFGGGFCVGNTLPHLCEEEAVRAFLEGLSQCLFSGSPLLLQLLNYDRILDGGERTFPLSLRPAESGDGTSVFLRLMTHLGNGRITFTPATLRYRPGSESPLEITAAHDVSLRGWRRAEVETLLHESGFRVRETFGSMKQDPWSPLSPDLVVVAERE